MTSSLTHALTSPAGVMAVVGALSSVAAAIASGVAVNAYSSVVPITEVISV
jgi:hypothetical protein